MSEFQYLPSEKYRRLPDVAGIYAFYYNPFKLNSIGLFRDFSQEELDYPLIRKRVEDRVGVYQRLIDSSYAEAHFDIFNLSGRKMDAFSGVLGTKRVEELSLADLSDEQIYEFLMLANQMVFLLSPIYVGMTVEQGISTRCQQHHSSYEKLKPGTFGGRLRAEKVDWSDTSICYACNTW